MKSREPADAVNSAAESTHKTGLPENAPTGHTRKAPTVREEKAPAYYCTSVLLGVVGVGVLRSLLLSHHQDEWARVRLYGLMLLLNLICRHGTKPLLVSADLADQYASPIKRPTNDLTIREPLALLCHIGMIEKTAAAVFCGGHGASR